MCRVRNTHTTAPWTTAYICLTLDDSCTDAEGKYIDKPLTVRMVQWQPYQVKTPFDAKTPVCSACKKTNRTRSFCRERHKHRHLPWCTVYVLLSALETADPATVVADPSKPVSGDDGEKEESKDGEDKDASSPTNGADAASATESKESDSPGGENIKPNQEKKSTGETKGDLVSDDINDIAESRTFLAKVNCQGTAISWLELADFEGEQTGVAAPGMDPGYAMAQPVRPGEPNQQGHYYHPAMGYASAQQHQSALKNHQQYFYHMQHQQQHHHHAAQYAAWQAHYAHPHHAPGQQSPQASAPGGEGEGGSSPVPVTAGEAAAQQQKRKMGEGGHAHHLPPPPPPPHLLGHPPPPPGQQPHGQQQWMLYQQMYQAQLPPMGHPPHYPPRAPGQPTEGGSPAPGANMGEYGTPSTPEGNGEGNEHENKRQRRS